MYCFQKRVLIYRCLEADCMKCSMQVNIYTLCAFDSDTIKFSFASSADFRGAKMNSILSLCTSAVFCNQKTSAVYFVVLWPGRGWCFNGGIKKSVAKPDCRLCSKKCWLKKASWIGDVWCFAANLTCFKTNSNNAIKQGIKTYINCQVCYSTLEISLPIC